MNNENNLHLRSMKRIYFLACVLGVISLFGSVWVECVLDLIILRSTWNGSDGIGLIHEHHCACVLPALLLNSPLRLRACVTLCVSSHRVLKPLCRLTEEGGGCSHSRVDHFAAPANLILF